MSIKLSFLLIIIGQFPTLGSHLCAAQEAKPDNKFLIVPRIPRSDPFAEELLPQNRMTELERLSLVLVNSNQGAKLEERTEIVQAIKRVGHVNATAFTPIIVDLLDFHTSEFGNLGIPSDAIPSNEDMFPSIHAIKKLGRSSVQPIIDSLADPKRSPLFQDNALYAIREVTDYRNNSTLRSILRDSSQEFLRRAKRLQRLSKSVERQSGPSVKLEVELLLPSSQVRKIEQTDNSDDIVLAAKQGDFDHINRLFIMHSKSKKKSSAAFLSQYLDLYNPKEQNYPAVTALIAFGPQGLGEVSRQISSSGKQKEFVLNGLQVIQQVVDSKQAIEILMTTASEFEQQTKVLESFISQLR